jgi:hypothetical protein
MSQFKFYVLLKDITNTTILISYGECVFIKNA